MRRTDPNLVLLARAVAHLGPLVDRMVFLGGCATALVLTDPAAPEVRPTRDVDVITEVGLLADYYRLAEELCGRLRRRPKFRCSLLSVAGTRRHSRHHAD